MSTVRFLTGITTSGTPHLGNYVGSIRPAVQASLRPGVESYYFLADYHALIKVGGFFPKLKPASSPAAKTGRERRRQKDGSTH